MATDAAQDAVELHHTRGRGLGVVDAVLTAGPPLLSACCRSGAHDSVDAQGASALLVAAPIAALVGRRVRSTLMISELAHAGALEPALFRTACAHGLELALTAAGGSCVLRVTPDGAVTGAGWSAAWTMPCDVRLTVERARAAAPAPPLPAGQLTADRAAWERLAARAMRYLVSGEVRCSSATPTVVIERCDGPIEGCAQHRGGVVGSP